MFAHGLIRSCFLLISLSVLMFQVQATSYYVSTSGLDGNAGTSTGAAWQTISKVNSTTLNAGDAVYFNGGQIFSGTLTVSRNGTSGNPIFISSYGTGRATINGGNGNAINVSSAHYVTIRNINAIGSGRKSGNTGNGISVSSGQNVLIDSVEVSGFQHSGIVLSGSSNSRVTNSYAHQNGFIGISSTGNSSNIYIGYCQCDSNPGDPSVTDNWSGSGIVVGNTTTATVEFCEASFNGWDQTIGPGNGPVGIWCWGCSHVTIQNCVSHDNQSTSSDGGGYDFDGGANNCMLQYSYSYNNHGAGILLCTWDAAGYPCANDTVRYNVFENDGWGAHNSSLYIYMGNAQSNMYVYNNVFYNSAGRDCISSTGTSTFYFWNNILIMRGSGKFTNNVGPVVLQGNCYWNLDNGGNWDGQTSLTAYRTNSGKERINSTDVGINVNPLLTNPGNGEKLIDPKLPTTLTAYKLQSNSPCIDAGLNLQTQFSMNPGTHDYYGMSIPQGSKFDIGACELSTTPAAPVFTSTAITTATVGVAYSYTVTATGNPVPTLSASGLPSWLSFNTTSGVLSGTPASGNSGTTGTITITATNSQGNNSQQFQIVVSTPAITAPTITSTALTSANVNVAYSYTVTATGYPAPTFSASGLPSWLTFNLSTATLSGTPTSTGTTGTITVTASNSQGNVSQTFTIAITNAVNLLTNPGFENGQTPWNVQGSSIVASNSHGGTYSAQVSGAGNGIWYFVSGLQPNTTYTLTAWVKLSDINQVAEIYAKNFGGAELYTSATITAYGQVTLTFTTGASTTTAEIGLWKDSGSGNAWVDDFSLTAGGGATRNHPGQKYVQNLMRNSTTHNQMYSIDGKLMSHIVNFKDLKKGVYIIKALNNISVKKILITQ